MTNAIVEGFGIYGVGNAYDPNSAVGAAMLSGAWAASPTFAVNSQSDVTLSQLPWDLTDPDIYLGTKFGVFAGIPGIRGWRRILPAAVDECCFSFYYACDQLPSYTATILTLMEADTTGICRLKILPTGGLVLTNARDPSSGVPDTILAASNGPVVVASSAIHLEVHVKVSTGAMAVYAGGVEVLNATGQTFSATGNIAQFTVCDTPGDNGAAGKQYIGNFIYRDSATGFPIGDRKVATLFVDADDLAHQGWTGEPLRRFGIGILNSSLEADSGVATPVLTATDLGNGDFTLEGQVRFKFLPGGANKAVIFSKWDEEANQRSYQLYKGGATLETGALVFRTSTDGKNGTVVEKFTWPWNPETGRWYHIAAVRASGELLFFVDGVQIGLPVADTDTYFAGSARTSLGVQLNASAAEAGTGWDGWFDEHRWTVGFARYTANFAPPTEGFPRGTDDAQWADVAWLSSWDNAVVADDGPLGLTLTAINGAEAITPDDGDFNYQTLNKPAPDDDTFIEAALVPAVGTFTLSALPTAGDTVTVGTKAGPAAAVYTFRAALAGAFDVLIGTDVASSIANLVAAINLGPGIGTVYGAGTTINLDVIAVELPSGQMLVTAVTPGAGGNAIASTTTAAHGAWGHATLQSGADIPSYSQFSLSRLPSGTTIVDSITVIARQWKSDGGPATTVVTFVGVGGGVEAGATTSVSTTPTLSFDVFDTDPDTSDPITPTTVLNSKVRIDRTT